MTTAWIIWQHDMINGHAQVIDSIYTNKQFADLRFKKLGYDNTNDDRLSAPLMAEIELDKVINLDLDITLSRDGKGIPITIT
jgi:hypothetical protein